MVEYPDLKEALRLWDAQEPVWTIEMGGISPGYEMCIQIGVFELVKQLHEQIFPEEDLDSFLDGYLRPINREFKLGLSGAQAGAIKNLAINYIQHGWAETLAKVENERRIQVTRPDETPTLETDDLYPELKT